MKARDRFPECGKPERQVTHRRVDAGCRWVEYDPKIPIRLPDRAQGVDVAGKGMGGLPVRLPLDSMKLAQVV